MASLLKIIYLKWRFRFRLWWAPNSLPGYAHLRDKKKCFVFLAADYGNLGDVAITYAQKKYLEEHFPGYEIVDIPISRTLSSLKALQHACSSDDIITIVGGGNMSDLYFDIELLRQMVVKAFPDNRIISFPQTMFFSESLGGRYLKSRARKIYSRHKNITIAARERWTFQLMREMLPKSILVPDIVMSLDKREPSCERKGITLCLRQDAESFIPPSFIGEIRTSLSADYTITDYDTHIGRERMTIEERENELEKIWTQFRKSEWVITDRLHGMIFAFITGTPCIVLPNNNYKIEGCYNWIKDCGYIHFIDDNDLALIIEILEKPINNNLHKDWESIKIKFNKLCQP